MKERYRLIVGKRYNGWNPMPNKELCTGEKEVIECERG
jgi:hypothetical protein